MLTLARPHRTRPHSARLSLRLRNILATHQQRRALLALDAHLLDDIGLTRAEAMDEAAPPLWDASQQWRGHTR